MSRPLAADKLLFPDVLWSLPQNPSRRRGHVIFVGGSPGNLKELLIGAAMVNRLGVNRVTLLVPESQAVSLHALLPELNLVSLPETPTRSLAKNAFDLIKDVPADCFILGFGATRHAETQELLGRLIGSIDRPLVIAADALEAVEPAILPQRPAPTFLLTDSGHFGRLLKKTGFTRHEPRPIVEYLYQHKEEALAVAAPAWHSTVVVTVPEAAAAGPDGRMAVLPTLPANVLVGREALLAAGLAALSVYRPQDPFGVAATVLTWIYKLHQKKPLPKQSEQELSHNAPLVWNDLEKSP